MLSAAKHPAHPPQQTLRGVYPERSERAHGDNQGQGLLARKVTDRGTFGYTIEDLYHILFSVLSLLTLR